MDDLTPKRIDKVGTTQTNGRPRIELKTHMLLNVVIWKTLMMDQ